jgi:hypothetical protein
VQDHGWILSINVVLHTCRIGYRCSRRSTLPHQESTTELFRAVNLRIRSSADVLEDTGELWQFTCECAADGCGALVELTLAEFDALIEHDDHVLAEGHVLSEEVPDRDDPWL